MNLKEFFALLLSKFVKRSETQFIAWQSTPEGWARQVWIKQNVINTEIIGTYTAPYSGYFCINAGNAITTIYIGGAVHSRMSVPASSTYMLWPQTFAFVRKGAIVDYQVSARSNQTEGSDIFFIPCSGIPD